FWPKSPSRRSLTSIDAGTRSSVTSHVNDGCRQTTGIPVRFIFPRLSRPPASKRRPMRSRHGFSTGKTRLSGPLLISSTKDIPQPTLPIRRAGTFARCSGFSRIFTIPSTTREDDHEVLTRLGSCWKRAGPGGPRREPARGAMAETRRGVPGAILAELQGQGHGKSARSPCPPGGPDQVRPALPVRTRPDGGGCPLPRPLSRSSPGSQPDHQPDLRGILPARGKGRSAGRRDIL